MNEHDSERIAGLLAADGRSPPTTSMLPTSVVLNNVLHPRTPTTSSTGTSAGSRR